MVLEDFYAASAVTSCDHGCGGSLDMDHLPLADADHWGRDYRGEGSEGNSYLSFRDESKQGLVKTLYLHLVKNDDGTYGLHDLSMNTTSVPQEAEHGKESLHPMFSSKSSYMGGVLAESLQLIPGSDAVITLEDPLGCNLVLSLHAKPPSADQQPSPAPEASRDE